MNSRLLYIVNIIFLYNRHTYTKIFKEEREIIYKKMNKQIDFIS